MNIETRNYGMNTSPRVRNPWSWYLSGRALCSDGTVRALARISETADTFFSVPAAVKVNGRTVAGYVTIESESGSSVATPDDPAVVKFVAVSYGKNADVLPRGTWRRERVSA